MSRTLAAVRRRTIGVKDEEALAFSLGGSAAWRHLETVVKTAVGGYHAVLEDHRLEVLVPRLEQTPAELRGYAYEGAAMGLAGMDCFLPGASRFSTYLEGPARHHFYMTHIGAGEALGRLRRSPEPFLRKLPDPVARWLVMDGYGFHEGFFKPARFVDLQHVPQRLSPFAARIFDQGVGRSIWFASGADVPTIAARIGSFPVQRQPDLWVGVGVACGYVGGVSREAVESLRHAAGPYALNAAVGTAFVAKGRHRAGNPTADTDLACEVLCGGIDSREAAAIVDQEWRELPDSSACPAYDVLQRRLSERLWVLANRRPAPVAAVRRAS